MKLLFVGYLHGYGGAEKQIIMLANAMAERAHYVSLVSLAENNPCYPISDLIEYDYIEDSSKFRIINIINRFCFLKKKISVLVPDLIINFNLQSAYLCIAMGKNVTNKVIFSERGDPYDKEYSGILAFLRILVNKSIKGFVFQTAGARDFFDDSVKKRSVIIHNPVFLNPDDYPVPVERDKRIVTVGRLHSQKNQRLLIEAISKLPVSLSEYKVEIYGDGELKEELQTLIESLGLQGRVHLMGAYKDIHRRIRNASLFVLSSDYEGMPNALLEAMAMGLPCISTDCRPGGARELIESGVNGIIVPCGDSSALADKIEYLLSNQQIAQTMGEYAQTKSRYFAPIEIYKQWESFFLKCVNGVK